MYKESVHVFCGDFFWPFSFEFFFLFPEFVAICVYLLQIMNTSTAEKN